jgi:predicted DNA-binding transcriptional regulator AlpA
MIPQHRGQQNETQAPNAKHVSVQAGFQNPTQHRPSVARFAPINKEAKIPTMNNYSGLAPSHLIRVPDIAQLAQVKKETAAKWTNRPGFPARTEVITDDDTILRGWLLGDVVGWLCASGRLDCATINGTPCADLLTLKQVAALTGLSLPTIKMYASHQRYGFPASDGPRIGVSPTWNRATIEQWASTPRRKVSA